MEGTTSPVKRGRRYDSSRRQRQALRTREHILETARRLFLSDGYVGTTIAAIAEAADVSVETIYKGFGGKPGLVRTIAEKGLEGAGAIPAEQRSDELQTLEADPRELMRRWGTLTTEVAPLVAPISLLVRTAAGLDAEMATLLEDLDRARLDRMEHNARALLERGDLRDGVTLENARDVLWTYSSPELYELLVLRRRWPLDDYGRFVADGMIAALLPSPAPHRAADVGAGPEETGPPAVGGR
jgi:AcrR family transcriptional regulator